MNKRSLLLLLIGVVFFVACTGHKKPVFTISLGGEPTELEFWEHLIAEFSRTVNVKVNFIRQPADTDQRRQQLVVALKSHQADPDVFLMDVAWTVQFAASGWLEPLNPLISYSGMDISVFFPKIISFADTYNGNIIALPVYIDGGLLYYRIDLLTQFGYNRPPQTWQELISYSQKIQTEIRKKNPNFYGFVWQGMQYEGLICDFLEFAGSNNGGFRLNSEHRKIDTSQNKEALELMYDLIHTYKISPVNTYTEMKEDDVRMYFEQGNALFERNWPYAWPLHQRKNSLVRGKIGIAQLPHFEGGQSVATLGGWHIGISKYSDVKTVAWKFVQFVESYVTQKRFAVQLGWNPAREDVYVDTDVLRKLPYFKQLGSILKHALPRPAVPYYSRMSEVMQKYINGAISGKMTPEYALSHAEHQIQHIVEVYEKN